MVIILQWSYLEFSVDGVNQGEDTISSFVELLYVSSYLTPLLEPESYTTIPEIERILGCDKLQHVLQLS